MLDDHTFALCLTHDVDRPFKTYQSPYYAVREGSLHHLEALLPGRNPYWQFEEVMAIEDDLGVRSAFYFLNEPHLFGEGSPRRWIDPRSWVQHLCRYDVTDPRIVDVIETLEDGGWEVGLHGSYQSHDDRERLRHEKEVLERIVDAPLVGGRQHYLNLSVPDTWHHYADIGLSYDTSLGSGSEYGFRHGYAPLRPFDDDFLVFPLTVMDQALPDPAERFDDAREACSDLLDEAVEHEAVMTALWHPRFFADDDFPGHARLYRRLVEDALDRGAWVGSPADLYRRLEPTLDRTDDPAPDKRGPNKGAGARRLSQNPR